MLKKWKKRSVTDKYTSEKLTEQRFIAILK